MRKIATMGLVAGLLMLCLGTWAKAADEKPEVVELTGILVKVSQVGVETTGWELHFANPVTIDGKSVTAVEVEGDANKFRKVENLRIGIKGIVTHPAADRIVIKVQKIKENV